MSETNALKINQAIEASIRRLSEMVVHTVELEGERFWLSVPSEPLLYQMGIAASVGMYNPKPNELESGHLAYRFLEKTESISYVFRANAEAWTAPGIDRNQYLGKLAVAGQDNADSPPTLITGRTKFGFRPMLVPIGRDGCWDQTFHQSVPDGELTHGGWLSIRYTYDGNTTDYITGGHMYDDTGRMLPELGYPMSAVYNSIDLISENDRMEPIAWRSFGNVLVCTRRFMISPSTKDYYRMGLLPQFKHDAKSPVIHPGTVTP